MPAGPRSSTESRWRRHRASLRRVGRGRAPDLDAVLPVDLGEPDAHVLGQLGGEVLADVVGADRQLAVPAVDHHRQLHRAGSSELGQRVEGGAHRAAGEEDVVDEHDRLAGEVDRHLGRPERLHRPQPDVVAVEGDVERADRHRDALDLLDGRRQALGDRQTPGVEADEEDVAGAVVALDDLVGDPGERPPQVVGVEHPGPEQKRTPVRGLGGAPRLRGRRSGAGRGHVLLRGDLTGSPSRSESG